MGHNQWGKSQSSGPVWPRSISLMLTTLESNVRDGTTRVLLKCCYIILVPMDLDVKMKAVMLGSCFLIVSIVTMLHLYKDKLCDVTIS